MREQTALVGALVSAIALCSNPAQAQTTKVEPRLYQRYGTKDQATFWVFFRQKGNLSGAASIRSKAAKSQHVIQTLRNTANNSQGGVRSLLNRRGISFESFWITNAIKVTADRSTMEALAARAEVERIAADDAFSIPQPLPSGPNPLAVDWNLIQIRA